MNKFLPLAVGLASCALLGGALGCRREGGPTPEQRQEPAPAVAASVAEATEPAPSAAAAPSSSDSAGPRSLPHTTAEQLRASIASAGKRATLVSAWASWCGPCRRELPMLQALSINLKPQRVDVVLVSVDEPKDELKAISYLSDNGITLKSYLVEGSLADFKVGVAPAWPGMLPASFLFDRSARLIHFWGGEAFENEITPVVEDFLAGRPVAAETRYGLAPGKLE
ncbi:MAG TPA: TlpA disulfide reductase family protein [Polyangiaceae bacterium]|nr:TlpA disulfide reductase family protein [Polyangiaceae bacterium]